MNTSVTGVTLAVTCSTVRVPLHSPWSGLRVQPTAAHVDQAIPASFQSPRERHVMPRSERTCRDQVDVGADESLAIWNLARLECGCVDWAEFPSGGRVTFVFTEVVGSTRTFIEHGDADAAALTKLHALIGVHAARWKAWWSRPRVMGPSLRFRMRPLRWGGEGTSGGDRDWPKRARAAVSDPCWCPHRRRVVPYSLMFWGARSRLSDARPSTGLNPSLP